MLCFVQGLSNRKNSYSKSREAKSENTDAKIKLSKKDRKKAANKQTPEITVSSEAELQRSSNFVKGKSLRLPKDTSLKESSEVKRSFSDRFAVISDLSGKKTTKSFLTIRKTWSTGNFASGGAGGGGGVPRSAPATPLQPEPHSRSKHDKHAVKPLSGSAPSVRAGADDRDPVAEVKLPNKSRQKKFQRHFPQVGPEERVVNYYSCALVGDLLLQGHLYITKNYFAFYSNVFGYVTKLLIPTTSVLRITKEKVARIIPNAVGVCTRDERHVFGSLLSRESTYKLMMQVWKATMVPEVVVPKPEELRISEVEMEASEYSPGDDSSSGGADHRDAPASPAMPEPELMIAAAASATMIQPALLTGSPPPPRKSPDYWYAGLLLLVVLLSCTALFLSYTLVFRTQIHEDLSGEELYAELARWRERLHGRATHELHAFLTTNLMLLSKVRQSLDSLSGVILADMAVSNRDVPTEGAAS